MDRAIARLKGTDLSVEEAAAMVGYGNASNFYRAFRARYHVSPREYVKARRCLDESPSFRARTPEFQSGGANEAAPRSCLSTGALSPVRGDTTSCVFFCVAKNFFEKKSDES